MSLYPPPLKKLIDHFADLPGIGKRAATRHVFYLLKKPQQDLNEFSKKLKKLKKETTLCERCLNIAHKKANDKKDLCKICSEEKRNQDQIMVVEKISDIESIEKSESYHGLYHVLGGTLPVKKQASTKKTGSASLNRLLERLEKRTKKGQKTEVILGLNPTKEGEITNQYLAKRIKNLKNSDKITLSRLGRGLPTGGEMAYADKATLTEALNRRSSVD